MSFSRTMALFLCLINMAAASGSARAGVVEIQALDFGTWLVAGNVGTQSVTVQTDGSYSSTAGLIMLEEPQEGIFLIDELPASSVITSIDVTMIQPMILGGGENFTLDNFTTSAPDTNGLGETTVTLGARARTSGNSVMYDDGNYVGQLEITINF